jgi:predicted small lipoprotein YifL
MMLYNLRILITGYQKMKRFTLALAAIAFVSSFSACGQSGPLYLPGDPSRLETIPPAPKEGDEEEKEESEGDK